MSEPRRIRRALVSVYDKTGVVEFCRALHEEFGVELISTGGTAKTLRDAGLPVTLVEQITGFPEMMDGRVKTLHPKIHAAILADRDNPEHMRQLAEQGIEPIDMVVVNLYPFEKTVADPDCSFEEAIEMIDIGGPCLLRAAAKNCRHVLVVPDANYEQALEALRSWHDCGHRDDALSSGGFSAFWSTCGYDSTISQWLSAKDEDGEPIFRVSRFFSWGPMRYGENPHQHAKLLLPYGTRSNLNLTAAEQGVDEEGAAQQRLSFNNYADASAALELCAELTRAGEHEGRAKLRFARRRFAPISDETTTRRHLPHWQIPGATYWVTFASKIGVLSEAERDIVLNAIRYWDGKRIDLHAAVVMPDHVHVLLTPREAPEHRGACYNLSELLRSIKSFSGREISQGRGGLGQVWEHESFDRWIRSVEDFEEKWQYITQNSVKEGLAPTPDAYRWWYAVDVLGLGIGTAANESTPRPPVLAERERGMGEARGESDKAEPCPSGEGRELDKAEPCPTLGEGELDKAEPCPTLAVCFIKHTNACGVAVDGDAVEAYRKAYLGNPNAAMGGILAVNFAIDAAFAETVMNTYQAWGKDAGAGGFFVEVWLAPSFDDAAVEKIRTLKAWGQRVRLLAVGDMGVEPDAGEMDIKRIAGGVLMQTRDLVGLNEQQWNVVSERQPSERELDDLRLAWLVCKHTKSNAITVCKDGMLIGNGAGQMSRVMSCRIATWLAKENGHDLRGAAAASDAFFPFRDGPDVLADAGVTALIQPGGSRRDQEVIDACNERGLAMILTGTRHFRH